ncbi:MAG: DNA-binding protein WhiA [Clostridiaceae bacterium]|nr:DNA-binding protein WhiA [Clostridiaceae bacterium]
MKQDTQSETKAVAKTVSAQLKEYILEKFLEDDSYQHLFFLSFASVGLKKQQDQLRYATYSEKLINFLEATIERKYNVEIPIIRHKEMYVATIKDKHLVERLNLDLEQFFLHNPANISEKLNPDEYFSTVRWILSGLFLGCGSLSDPNEHYNLEFAIPKRSTSLWYGLFLAEIGLEPGRVLHQGSEILYIKESDKISDFLRYIAADKLLLEFEQIRVKKEMRNHVNRIVNCDNANAQRIANSVTRQINNINWLKENDKWSELPHDLQKIANLRLEYPTYSLKDLGEQAEPPLGKSGINYRLKKIEKFVEKLKKS